MQVEADVLNSVVGKTMEQAAAILRPHGIQTIRARWVDGQPQIGTSDMRTNRLNVSLQGGIIDRVSGIG
jgi:hypothetical protein